MEKDEKMIEKIKKVMELASRGSTEAERDTAMLQAQKLLDKHNLTLLDITNAEKVGKYEEGEGIAVSFNSTLMERTVGQIIQDFYNIQIIVHKDGDGYRTLRMFGRTHNVTVASYMHGWLMREFDNRWNHYKDRNGLKGRKYKNTFIYGMYHGLTDKLKAQREQVVKEYDGSMEVAVLDESDQIMNWITSMMDIKSGAKHKVNLKDVGVLNDGVEEGNNINLNTQIN